jgi:glucosamine--fructose-6-phosphate aminotransferase (isomerizing)
VQSIGPGQKREFLVVPHLGRNQITMCGIVGAVAKREVSGILCEGLQRLEYRGYDSAGIAVVNPSDSILQRMRKVGKVKELVGAISDNTPRGTTGIAHTRWATHGKPTEENAHPHMSGNRMALVHNGIIENHVALRQELQTHGYQFHSETDTEVVVHLIDREVQACGDLLAGLKKAVQQLTGAFALGILHRDYPDRIVAARVGSPLIIGVGIGENFIASDAQALRPVTDRFIYLEEGELVELTCDGIAIYGVNEESVESRTVQVDHGIDAADKAGYRHYMLKEIFEQPQAIENTLAQRIDESQVLESAFGVGAAAVFEQTRAVQIVACGSSYYTALIARYWIEDLAGIPCQVEIASEIRYRKVAVQSGTLFVTISQSGETADTLAALSAADDPNYVASLCICNVPGSSLVRESDLSLMIHAGPEICVASTKAFTTQLADLLMLAIVLGARNGLSATAQQELVLELRRLPDQLRRTLEMNERIAEVAEDFVEKDHALFLGRGIHYPVALEGALKLKEISYIHAEGYPAGELKHGPLALVDDDMPVVAVAPNNELLEKLKSNLQEVRARGGQLYVFADLDADIEEDAGCVVIPVPGAHSITAPIIYTLPMQLLSYHVAVLKGTDVDQPRNLAKSVTVE